jgi:hypothetical protein
MAFSLSVFKNVLTMQVSGYLDIKGTAYPDVHQEHGVIHSASFAKQIAQGLTSYIKIAQLDSIFVFLIVRASTTTEIILPIHVF